MCLAEAKEKLGQFEEAISYYEAIISTKNVDPKIILLKAECEKRCGKYEEYISTLKMYLNANKNLKMGFGSLYYKIGYGYYKLDDYHNAIMNL